MRVAASTGAGVGVSGGKRGRGGQGGLGIFKTARSRALFVSLALSSPSEPSLTTRALSQDPHAHLRFEIDNFARQRRLVVLFATLSISIYTLNVDMSIRQSFFVSISFVRSLFPTIRTTPLNDSPKKKMGIFRSRNFAKSLKENVSLSLRRPSRDFANYCTRACSVGRQLLEPSRLSALVQALDCFATARSRLRSVILRLSQSEPSMTDCSS